MGFVTEIMPVGARIVGLDCSAPISEEDSRLLYAAWLEHGFLVIEGPVTTAEDHLRLSRCFGELEKHPLPQIWVEGEPYLIQLGGSQRGLPYVVDGELRLNVLAWHRDTAYTLDICKGAALRMMEVTPEAGQTYLADTAKAYDALPEETKRRIDGLEVKVTYTNPADVVDVTRGKAWNSARRATQEDWPEKFEKSVDPSYYDRFPPVIQPVVVTHPESGRKCIYLSPTYCSEILGMDRLESDALLDELVDHMTRPEFRYDHSWSPDQVLVWDNRRCIHATSGYHPQYRRSGQRTTFADPLKTGRYFDPKDAERIPEYEFSPDRD